jgi:outer membrane protein TolC
MKTLLQMPLLALTISVAAQGVTAQTLQVSPELKDLIMVSVNRDHKVTEKTIDREIAISQRKAVRQAYIPKLELGGKYLYAQSSLDSKFGDVSGFESLTKLQEFMGNPAFPVMFPNLAGLSNEITQLQQILAQQGMALPSLSNKMAGDFNGNYYGFDATVKMLLFSGGQVPNASKALTEKVIAQEALTDKCTSDVISEVITCYDQLALMNQSKQVLDESAVRLDAEKKYALSALKNGFATTFDTLKIAVADASLQAKRAEYESKQTLLHEKLAQLSGRNSTTFAGLNPGLELLLFTANSRDISNRAELRALNAGLEAQKYMLKSEKSHFLPKIQAIASARYDNVFNADANMSAPLPMDMKIDNMTLGPTFLAGVGFKWEIFDQSGGSAKVRQAMLEVKKAENARDEARELLELNYTKVTNNYQSAIAQVSYKEKQRHAAHRALEMAQKAYNEGMMNITERLVAETEMQNAELEYLQAIFVQRQAALECYKANGDLVLSNIR